MSQLTWGKLKEIVEEAGVQDEAFIQFIDVTGMETPVVELENLGEEGTEVSIYSTW